MAAFSTLNALKRKKAIREARSAIESAINGSQVGVYRTITITADSNGAITSSVHDLQAEALLDAIDAQTAGVAGPARTITKNADTSLTIA
jgi:hypothetical protein